MGRGSAAPGGSQRARPAPGVAGRHVPTAQAPRPEHRPGAAGERSESPPAPSTRLPVTH